MRINGALSGVERVLQDEQELISRTDARGLITYVNQDFIDLTGFSEAELIGQPHNIVRHPDMPSAVFADMWRDLQAGRAWKGIIANRCRNGDEYWIEAHVSPIHDGDEITGYLSVRRQPTAQARERAAALYARMRAPGGEQIIFRHGTEVSSTLGARLVARFTNKRVPSKFLIALLIASSLILALGTYVMAAYLSRALDENARQELRHNVGLVRAAVEARFESAHIAVEEYSRTLSLRVTRAMGGQANSNLATLTRALREARPEGGNPINVFLDELHGVATIFTLTPEGFHRELTNAIDDQGKSLSDTFLAVDHPAYPMLLAGKVYIGPARVSGHQYVTCYRPLFGSHGEVIGAVAMGVNMAEQLDTLKRQIRSMRVGETGYYYIIDVTPGVHFGLAILHPYREGANLYDESDQHIRELIRHMAASKAGEVAYLWHNTEAGEVFSREKLVIYQTIANTPWIIAGGTASDEFSALSHRVALMVVIGGIGLTLAILAVVFFLLRRLVIRPLNDQVLPAFKAISAGQYDTPIHLNGEDEMAQVLIGLDNLRNRLAFERDRERSLAKLREAARAEAEALSRARAEFLANMSHEIRTPLNAIIGLAYLLGQAQLAQRESDYIRRIEGAGKLLLAIINDVLDFSKIDAGRLQLEEADFRLDDVLDNLSNLVRSRIQEKNLLLEYVVAPDTPMALRGDALRLSQILINLVGNAIKFTSQGAITVFVDAQPQQDGQLTMTFRVRDTGIGMSAEQQGNLFRPFSQADSSITRKFGGTGLGLVICKRLVEMMQGEIRVDSSPDIGSTFTFHVRLGIGAAARNTPVVPADFRVMVVDDNDLARAVQARLLINLGCQVETVESGAACLARLRQPDARFDCIMLDLNMPDMDGLTLAAHLRQEARTPVKLVAVTAENIHTARYRYALDDFDAIVEKPATAARLAEVLAEIRSPSGQENRNPPRPARDTLLAGIAILVAEDVPTNQLIMVDLLESLGARVTIAENGFQAIAHLATPDNQTDIVLMDIQMPELDGLEATRRIRSGAYCPDADIPIIALTANALESERQRALEVGMNDYLTKPIEPQQLIKLIQRWHRRSDKLADAANTADESASTPAAPLPDIPGIDVAGGMRRMLQRRPLYEKVLREFVGRFEDEPERIRHDIEAGDLPSAIRRAHSLKGTAGMIGAEAVASLASSLEQQLKGGNADVGLLLQECAAALLRATAGIRLALP